MKRLFLFIAALTLLMLSIPSFFQRNEVDSVDNIPLTSIKHRDFQITVETLGTLHAINSHMVSSQIKGQGAKIIFLAPDGYPVIKGDILVRFDPTTFEESIAEHSAQIEDLTAGVEAAKELLEWEKTEVGQQITTAGYNLKIARLDQERLVQGEGPMTLAQYREERDKAQLELKRYQDYAKDLEKLAKDGYNNPAELRRVRDNITVYKEKFSGHSRRYTSYQEFVLPSMIESAKAKVQNAELSLQQTKQAGVHKIARAKATLQQVSAKLKKAKSTLIRAESELDKTVVRAPFDGLLIHYETFRNGEKRAPREGDTVIINQPILYLPDITNLIVKSKIREIDLHKITVGQSVTITVEAYPNTRYQGKVSFIGALAEKRSGGDTGEKYFQIQCSLDTTDDSLRPGMTTRVEIQTADLHHVLALPVEAVFQDSAGPFCYLHADNKITMQRLQTGHSNEDFVEIINGLEAGMQVSMVMPVAN